MDPAAVWQHSSNSSIKIVHNCIEHFLWNPSDLFFDDVLSLLSVDCFHKVCLSGTPLENSQAGWDLGNKMARDYWFDAKWVCPMESYALGIQVFCSRNEVAPHFSNTTEHLNTSGKTSHGTDSFRIKPISPCHPILKVSNHLTIFWGGTCNTEFVKTIHRQERTTSEEKLDWFHKKRSIALWTILMFELLLSCHTAAWCIERT